MQISELVLWHSRDILLNLNLFLPLHLSCGAENVHLLMVKKSYFLSKFDGSLMLSLMDFHTDTTSVLYLFSGHFQTNRRCPFISFLKCNWCSRLGRMLLWDSCWRGNAVKWDPLIPQIMKSSHSSCPHWIRVDGLWNWITALHEPAMSSARMGRAVWR